MNRVDVPGVLWLALGLALLLRGWLIFFAGGASMVDGDEALVGIQAQRILQGERPIYFYGQAYMGSLEAYLMAVLFAIGGSSSWMLRVEPLLLCLLLVWLTHRFALMLADWAKLSQQACRSFVAIATLMAAIVPLYNAVVELRTLGGYIELFVLLMLLLMATLGLTRALLEARPWFVLVGCWAAIGFILGLGFWVNALIVTTALAVALWIGGVICFTIIAFLRTKPALSVIVKRCGGHALFMSVALPAFVLGSAPALYWGFFHEWQNVHYLVNRGGRTTAASVGSLLLYYVACAAPRVVGGSLPDENFLLIGLHILPFIVGVLSILISVVLVVRSYTQKTPSLLQARRLVALPLLVSFCSMAMFSIGTQPVWCPSDGLGRYVVPLALMLPFFVAAASIVVQSYLADREREPQGTHEITGNVGRPRKAAFLSHGLTLLLVLLFCMQGASYFLTHPGKTFLPHSCVTTPADNDALVQYMQHENIRYAWASTWIGNPIIFETQGSIVVADPRPVIDRSANLGRVPEFVETVLQADRPALLSFVRHDDSDPELLRVLDQMGIVYKTALFPAQPGVEILVVQPLNRTVDLTEISKSQKIFVPCADLLLEDTI